MERIQHLLEESRARNISLATSDCNLLLLRVVTDIELSEEDVLHTLLDTHRNLTRSVATGEGTIVPDARTYEIPVLDRRLSNTRTALRLQHEMMKFSVPATIDVLHLGMLRCELESNLPLAKKWLECTLGNESRTFKVPVVLWMMENMISDATLTLFWVKKMRETTTALSEPSATVWSAMQWRFKWWSAVRM
jgi:hypothetical protein